MAPESFPLSKLLFMFVKSLARPISRRVLARANTDAFFKQYVCLPPANLYHFYEAKIKFRVMNVGRARMARVRRLGEKEEVELGANLASEFIIYTVAMAICANEVLKYKERVREEEDQEEEAREELVEEVGRLGRLLERQEEALVDLESLVEHYRHKLKS